MPFTPARLRNVADNIFTYEAFESLEALTSAGWFSGVSDNVAGVGNAVQATALRQPLYADGDRFAVEVTFQIDGTVAGNIEVFVVNPVIKRLPCHPAMNYKQRLHLERISDSTPYVALLDSAGNLVTAAISQYTTPVA